MTCASERARLGILAVRVFFFHCLPVLVLVLVESVIWTHYIVFEDRCLTASCRSGDLRVFSIVLVGLHRLMYVAEQNEPSIKR